MCKRRPAAPRHGSCVKRMGREGEGSFSQEGGRCDDGAGQPAGEVVEGALRRVIDTLAFSSQPVRKKSTSPRIGWATTPTWWDLIRSSVAAFVAPQTLPQVPRRWPRSILARWGCGLFDEQ